MPVLNTALNPLDPTGRTQSQHVDCWHGRPTPADLPSQPYRTISLLRRHNRDGQLALIWTDFQAPLAHAAARLVRPLAAKQRFHLLPRTDLDCSAEAGS